MSNICKINIDMYRDRKFMLQDLRGGYQNNKRKVQT